MGDAVLGAFPQAALNPHEIASEQQDAGQIEH
jgi:hypothetical protein